MWQDTAREAESSPGADRNLHPRAKWNPTEEESDGGLGPGCQGHGSP